MSLIRRNARKREAAEQQRIADELHERAARLIDTHGVVLNAAEAELAAAIADVRLYATPEREQRVAEAQQRVAEARRALEESRSGAAA